MLCCSERAGEGPSHEAGDGGTGDLQEGVLETHGGPHLGPALAPSLQSVPQHEVLRVEGPAVLVEQGGQCRYHQPKHLESKGLG